MSLHLPRGTLVRSRVVSDPGVALDEALVRGLTGYAVLEPQDAILLETDASGVLTFDDGVPVLAYHAGTDRGGPNALADLAVPGPYSVDLYELGDAALAPVHDTPELRVPPGMPADRLAGDAGLVDRTRERAPAGRLDADAGSTRANDEGDRTDVTADGDDGSGAGRGAVEAFLDDPERIADIKEQARAEARSRAAEWGLDDELAGE